MEYYSSAFLAAVPAKLSSSLFFLQHKDVLPYMWTVAINLGIFLATYRYRKYAIFGHFLIGFGVAFITLLFTFPVLLNATIPSKSSRMRMHMITGFVIVVAIFLQVVLGCLSKLLNLCKVPSVLLYYMNKTHVVLGYLLTILNKVQVYYYIEVNHRFWVLIAQDCLFLVLILLRKLLFPNMEAIVEPIIAYSQQVKKITSLSQLAEAAAGQPKDYCVFSNYVYDLQPLRLNHPVGYQILELVKNREIDRFIYGMFRAERLPNLPASSHSFRSFELLGPPVACIDIPSPFAGMPTSNFEVRVAGIHKIYENSHIYQINFAYEQPFAFKGYETVQQLGRFHSLTVNGQVTRLYTSVNFLYASNIALLNRLGIQYQDSCPTWVQNPENINENELVPTSERTLAEKRANCVLPMLLKVYYEGTLPNLLVSHRAKSVLLSPVKGLGLCLGELQKGTVLIIAGGTGLYPFADLIDLLFKDHKVAASTPLQKEILDQNPVLKTGVLSKFRFRLLLACDSLRDIHPITLSQITELNGSRNFSSLVRIKQPHETAKLQLSLTEKHFEQILEGELKGIQDLAKVWVCGPPKMGYVMSQYFSKAFPDQDILFFV